MAICLDFDWQTNEFMVYCLPSCGGFSHSIAYQQEREKRGIEKIDREW